MPRSEVDARRDRRPALLFTCRDCCLQLGPSVVHCAGNDAVVARLGTTRISGLSMKLLPGDKSFPVRKFTDLLKKMQVELTQAAANDQAIMTFGPVLLRIPSSKSPTNAERRLFGMSERNFAALFWTATESSVRLRKVDHRLDEQGDAGDFVRSWCG